MNSPTPPSLSPPVPTDSPDLPPSPPPLPLTGLAAFAWLFDEQIQSSTTTAPVPPPIPSQADETPPTTIQDQDIEPPAQGPDETPPTTNQAPNIEHPAQGPNNLLHQPTSHTPRVPLTFLAAIPDTTAPTPPERYPHIPKTQSEPNQLANPTLALEQGIIKTGPTTHYLLYLPSPPVNVTSPPVVDEETRTLASCPICYDIPRTVNIYQCTNGHCLCASCLRKIQNATQRSRCPSCDISIPLDKSKVCRNLIAEAIRDRHVQHDILQCQFPGCTYQAHIIQLLIHEERCLKRYVTCPATHTNLCTWTGPLADLINHMSSRQCVQFIRADPDTKVYSQHLIDFDPSKPLCPAPSVFNTCERITFKPLFLVSPEHIKLFPFILIQKLFDREWTVTSYAYGGKTMTANYRISLQLQHPDHDKQPGQHPTFSSNNKLAPYDMESYIVHREGYSMLLRDGHIRHLRSGTTLLQWTAKIPEHQPATSPP